MAKFVRGEAVAVPVTVRQGAFPGESLVTIETNTGPVSGFARERDFAEPARAISGVVRDSTPQTLSVQLAGSYFITNGLVELPAGWAAENVKVIA